MSQFVKSFLTLYLFCYRKGFITPQQALYLLLRNGKWRIGQSLKLIKSYLSNLQQKTKVNVSFSSFSNLILRVPFGLLFRLKLLNIYINNIFNLTELIDVFNYANDTTFFASDSNLKSLSYQKIGAQLDTTIECLKRCPEICPRKKCPPRNLHQRKIAHRENCPQENCPTPPHHPKKMHSKKLFYYIFVVVNIILQFFYKLFIVTSFRGMSRSPVTSVIDALVTVINGIN